MNQVQDLRKLLEESGIDISSWGQGPTKTIDHLQKEITEGETILEKNENGELIRKVTVINIFVYYKDKDGKIFILKEAKQVFKNGTERLRDFEHSVSEKFKSGEDIVEAAIRALREELSLDGEINLEKIGISENEAFSNSYPGLKSIFKNYKFKTYLNSSQYQPEGYKEVQEGMSTYFIWQEVEL